MSGDGEYLEEEKTVRVGKSKEEKAEIPLTMPEAEFKAEVVLGKSVTVKSKDKKQILFTMTQEHEEAPDDPRISGRDNFDCEIPVVIEGTKYRVKMKWSDEQIREGQPGVTLPGKIWGKDFYLEKAVGEKWEDISLKWELERGQSIIQRAMRKTAHLQTGFNWQKNEEAKYAVEILDKVREKLRVFVE